MNAFMILVCALVLLQIVYFLVLITGELTLWFSQKIGAAYRENKRRTEAVFNMSPTVMPKA